MGEQAPIQLEYSAKRIVPFNWKKVLASAFISVAVALGVLAWLAPHPHDHRPRHPAQKGQLQGPV